MEETPFCHLSIFGTISRLCHDDEKLDHGHVHLFSPLVPGLCSGYAGVSTVCSLMVMQPSVHCQLVDFYVENQNQQPYLCYYGCIQVSENLGCFKESLNSFWQFFTTLSSSQLLLFLESCIIFFLASSVLFPDAGDTLLELIFLQRTQVVNFLDTCLAILVRSEREFVSSWCGFPLYMWVGLCPHEARTLNVRAHM